MRQRADDLGYLGQLRSTPTQFQGHRRRKEPRRLQCGIVLGHERSVAVVRRRPFRELLRQCFRLRHKPRRGH